MFHHITLLRFKKEATAAQIEIVIEKLREVPKSIQAIKTYVVEKNAGINDGTFDLALVASFADLEAYRAYQSDPAHKKVATEFVLPIAAEFASIQYSH